MEFGSMALFTAPWYITFGPLRVNWTENHREAALPLWQFAHFGVVSLCRNVNFDSFGVESFSISQVWLSDTCQSNFAIADILGGENPKITQTTRGVCLVLNLPNKQFNPKREQSGPKLGGWNSKVDNWHLISATLELNVTFEDIYAIKDHWLHLQRVHTEFWKAG